MSVGFTHKTKKEFIILILFSLSLFLSTFQAFSQCSGFPATLADADCAGGTALSNNANMNGGGNYSYCATSSTTTSFSSLNLNGGVLRICGNANLSGNWNSGTIVVSCGSTVNFNSGLTLNNGVKIVNYGTVNVSGDLQFQNTNNAFFNESETSVLNVTGNLSYPQNNGQNAYLKNYGRIKINGTFNALEGGYTCFGNTGILETNNIRYIQNCGGPANRFTFASGTGTAVIRYTGNATLNATFTNSSNWQIQRASGATQTFNCSSSWGSATVINNAPVPSAATTTGTCPSSNCYTSTLPIKLISFSAVIKNNQVALTWKTSEEINNSLFQIERSFDATHWNSIKTIKGAGNSNVILTYNYTDEAIESGILYYRLKQEDWNGDVSYSPILSVNHVLQTIQTNVYPNPAVDKESFLSIADNDEASDYLVLATTMIGQVIVNHSIENEITGPFHSTIPLSFAGVKDNMVIILVYKNGALIKTHKLALQ